MAIIIGVDKAAYTKQTVSADTDFPSDILSSGTGSYADWNTTTSANAWVKLITSGGATLRISQETTDIKSDVVPVAEGVIASSSAIEVELNLNRMDPNVWADLLGTSATNGKFEIPGTYQDFPIVNFALVSRTVDGKKFFIWFKKAVAVLKADGLTDNSSEYKYTIIFRAVASYDATGTPQPVVEIRELTV